jgi:alpha-galactosidase
MAPRITFIGGGSNQWTPVLVTDIVNTPSLHEAEIVLQDINPAPLPKMASLVEHLAQLRGIPMTVRYTTDQRAAIEGADYVVVTITTGGFASMRPDVEIPARYGIPQAVGDAGPAGVSRCLRNIPVLVDIAKEMEQLCPDAWLLNLTNPMTQLVRAITRETSTPTVGLCHEVTICRFYLSMLLDADFRELEPTVVGVNHLPFMTKLRIGDDDNGLDRLRMLLDGPAEALDAPLPFEVPDMIGHTKKSTGQPWTKADLLDINRVKIELFRRFGALPAAGDRHLTEYFPGFVTEASEWGKRWGVRLTTIEEREEHERMYASGVDEQLAATELSTMPSGEMLAPVIDSMRTNRRRTFPLNLPNRGQAPEIPPDVVVETMCVVDSDGVRGGEPARAPGVLGEYVRRVAATHELTVEAALSGDRDTAIAAMLSDPVASRIDYDLLVDMTNAMINANLEWLPRFA